MPRPLHGLVFLLVAMLAGCIPERTGTTAEQLTLLRESIRRIAGEKREELYQTMKRRVIETSRRSATENPSLNVLVLSGGGEFGAFGTGVLQGWSRLEQPAHARPQFDLVTGVSTGALIAPFAFIGDEASIERIDQLYAQADPKLAVLRSIFFFLPSQESFLDVSELQKRLEAELDQPTLRAVARAHDEDRRLLIGATDLDLGRMHIFDMGDEAKRAVEWNTNTWFTRLMLASAAIPAAFPPVEIEGRLYADGGATEQFILGFDASMIRRLITELRAEKPNALPVKVRIWVIVNNKLSLDPQPTKPAWIPIATRSLSTLMKYSMRLALYRVALASQAINALYPAQVELRWLAIPDDFDTTKQSKAMFDRALMHRVAALGMEMGANPASWQTEVPAFEWADAIEPVTIEPEPGTYPTNIPSP